MACKQVPDVTTGVRHLPMSPIPGLNRMAIERQRTALEARMYPEDLSG